DAGVPALARDARVHAVLLQPDADGDGLTFGVDEGRDVSDDARFEKPELPGRRAAVNDGRDGDGYLEAGVDAKRLPAHDDPVRAGLLVQKPLELRGRVLGRELRRAEDAR